MIKTDLPPFDHRRAFARWAESGFREGLLPVLPPDAELSGSSRVSPSNRGKVPGRWDGNVWTGLPDWTGGLTSTADLAAWLKWPKCNLGLRAARFPAIDIDVSDTEIVEGILFLAEVYLGAAPIRRRANSARVLLMYATGPATSPVRKMRIAFWPAGANRSNAKPHAVEVLGAGQHFVIEGVHPTGAALEWEAPHPCDLRPEGLTRITPETISTFLAAVEGMLREHSAEIVTDSRGDRSGVKSRRPVGDPALACDIALLREAVAAIPNDLDYDRWVRMLAAIKGASGGSEEGYSIAEEWSLQWPDNTPEAVRAKWESLVGVALGAGYVLREAQAHGFNVAAEEFDPVEIDEGARFFVSNTQEPLPMGNVSGCQPARSIGFNLSPFIPIAPFLIPPRRWIYGRHLIRQFVSATLAAGGTGKTSLHVGEALALTSGRPLLGHDVHEGPIRVWLHNAEDPVDELHRRIAAAMQLHGVTADDIGGRLFLSSGRDTPICLARSSREGVMVDRSVEDTIIKVMLLRQIDVLLVDPFISTHAVPENDNTAIDAVAKAWARIADAANTAIDIAHHTRKLGGADATADSGRGASSFNSAVRSARVLQAMSPDEARKLGLSAEEARRFVRVDNGGKENMAISPAKAEWIRLESVALANGDNVGVATRWTPPDMSDGLNDDALRSIKEAVAGRGFAVNNQAHNWVGVAMAGALGLNAVDPAVQARMRAMQVELTKRGYFVEREGRNQARRTQRQIEVGDGTGEGKGQCFTS